MRWSMDLKKDWKLKIINTRSLFILVWAFIFGVSCHAATWLDPELKWKTIETPHFYIHYYKQIEPAAKKMIPIVEDVYNKLSPIFKHAPDYKTQVVLVDNSDYTNGFTTVIPNPSVTIYLMDGGSNLRPAAYETWLKYVFLHEYAHVLHLDTVEGSGTFFKNLFGRAIFPNAMMPNFATEGFATYMETRHGYGGGRGNDPRYEAMMRMDVLENKVKSIDKAAVNTISWPGGTLRYLYGVMFLQYLSEKYGEEKLMAISHEYGDYLLQSYGFDGMFKDIYEKDFKELWQEWLDDLKQKYQKQKEEVSKEGLTSYKTLTQKGYYCLKPKWSADSKQVYYISNNQDEYSSINSVDRDSFKIRKVIEGIVFDDSLAVSKNNLFFIKGNYYKNFNVYKDLFQIDLISGKEKKLTKGERIADPAVNQGIFAYTKNYTGTRALYLSDEDFKNTKIFSSPEAQYFSPAFSPDGTQVAVSKWKTGERQDIYLIDVKSGVENKIISFGLSANPCFSPDGEYVIFDSDASGICNIYAYHLNSKKIYKVTNVLGAAMMPDVSPDSKRIAFVNYSSNGHDIAIMDYKPGSWKAAPKDVPDRQAGGRQEELTGIISSGKNKTVAFETTNYDYNPIQSLIPKFWFPYSYYDENGPHTLLYTAGIDALNQHMFEVKYGHDWTAKRPTFNISYINNQFFPQLSVSAYDIALPYNWDSNKTYWERQCGANAALAFLGNGIFAENDRQIFSFGCVVEALSNISSLEIFTKKPSLGDLRGVFLNYKYSSLRSYANSISPEDGISLSLNTSIYLKDLGSKYAFNRYSASFGKYFGLPSHNVLAYLASANWIKGEQLEQEGFTWEYQRIKGYPSNSFPGNKQISQRIEYRFPIWLIESGFGYGATFFERLWGKAFIEAGTSGYAKFENLPLSKSYGMEIDLNTLNAFGYVPYTISIGYARGIDALGQGELYYNISM